MVNTTAIIAAAGKSLRMGNDTRKQFINIGDKPILSYTIAKFEDCKSISSIIIGISEDSKDIVKNIIKKFSFKKVSIIIGGDTRQDTVKNCLNNVSKETDIIIVHDGVRPFIKVSDIQNVIDLSYKKGCAILALPVKDTLKNKDENGKVTTINRSNIWIAQTPQGFKKDIIKDAFTHAYNNNIQATDEASLVENISKDIFFVEGSYNNIKITTSEDLLYAEFLLDQFKSDNKYTKDEKKHISYDVESDTIVTIYTDGACSNNPGVGGYGAVLLYNGKRKEISQGFKSTTNNRMELTSVIHALLQLKGEGHIVNLYSDSKYVVDAINKKWVYKWSSNNWMRNAKEKALNIDLWEQLLPLLKIHNVTFIWVKGHANNKENERCDFLARQAIQEFVD